MRKNLLVLLILLSFLLPSAALARNSSVEISAAERKMAESITAEQLKDYLYFVASDEMGGRDTPSQGLDITAKFIGTLLSRWGFKPAGDGGTFFQKISLLRELPDPDGSALKIGGQSLGYGEDYFRLSGGSDETISAPLVYGGDGWLFKAKGIDALQNVDAKGKIVVLYSDGVPNRFSVTTLPKGVTQADFAGKRGEDWVDPLTYAKQKGAIGVIVVASNAAAGMWDRLSNPPRQRQRPFVEKFREEVSLPTIMISQKAGDMIFADPAKAPYKDSAAVPALKPDAGVSFKAAINQERVYTQNVVGIWEGGDPVLKNEMVAIGAHYDHVGTNENASGSDKIWNGADDDGSGTVAVLSIAEALAKAPQRPKRSILFVWHAGEEKGLWGSEYFNKFPTVDITKVVAQLNIDMIGRSKKDGDTNSRNRELSGENEVYVIGSEMMSSKLGEVTKGTNDAYLKIIYNYKYDDPKDSNRFFFRSDHFNYAVNGIPIVFWFDGVHEDYHGPGDEPQKIDYQKMERITRTIFLTMWEVASLKDRPMIDKQLPPELTQRN
ncbi:MAG: M20/M25/M40 family metallo-hydrolase [Pyrinomonadaceae bacterium]